jgi:hypothetical protein
VGDAYNPLLISWFERLRNRMTSPRESLQQSRHLHRMPATAARWSGYVALVEGCSNVIQTSYPGRLQLGDERR